MFLKLTWKSLATYCTEKRVAGPIGKNTTIRVVAYRNLGMELDQAKNPKWTNDPHGKSRIETTVCPRSL